MLRLVTSSPYESESIHIFDPFIVDFFVMFSVFLLNTVSGCFMRISCKNDLNVDVGCLT